MNLHKTIHLKKFNKYNIIAELSLNCKNVVVVSNDTGMKMQIVNKLMNTFEIESVKYTRTYYGVQYDENKSVEIYLLSIMSWDIDLDVHVDTLIIDSFKLNPILLDRLMQSKHVEIIVLYEE